MKIVTVLGSRPQFIKSVLLTKKFRENGIDEIVIHTGQHYDEKMSNIFFSELDIPEPKYNLALGSGSHAYQTAQALIKIEEILLEEKADWVLVYGDTNATLAGALAASKLNIPIAHIESGLRSYDRSMPEEVNRIIADQLAKYLFCPTEQAVQNLKTEKVMGDIFNVGDVMYDGALFFKTIAEEKATVLKELSLQTKDYILATIHRDFNTDHRENLENIVKALVSLNKKVVFPIHPRAKKQLIEFDLYERLEASKNMLLIDPVGYLDMIQLEANAECILTDSGGVQKEAYFYGIPCLTIRPSTEWVETIEHGWNQLVEANEEAIVKAVQEVSVPEGEQIQFYGSGNACEQIIYQLLKKRDLQKR